MGMSHKHRPEGSKNVESINACCRAFLVLLLDKLMIEKEI